MKNKQNNLVDYIKENSTKSKKSHKERVFLDGIDVIIVHPLTKEINLDKVLYKLKTSIPHFLFQNVEAIYIGQFKELYERDLNAAYMDGALYITNKQVNEENMLEDMVHEIAHSVEELAKYSMYSDNKVNKEFLMKRLKLMSLLTQIGYEVEGQSFQKIEYDRNFDMFLYEVIGYEALNQIVPGLFCSPYGATSIREYFANGFEFFFLKDRQLVKDVSPQLYHKLADIEKGLYLDEEDEDTEDMSY